MAGDAQDSVLSTIANSIGIATFAFSALNLWFLFYRRSLKFESDVRSLKWQDLMADLERRESFMRLQPAVPHSLPPNPPVFTYKDRINYERCLLQAGINQRLEEARNILSEMAETWDPIKKYLGITGIFRGLVEGILPIIQIPWVILKSLGGGWGSGVEVFGYAMDVMLCLIRLLNVFWGVSKKKGKITAQVWRSMFGWRELSEHYQRYLTTLHDVDSRIMLLQGLNSMHLQSTIDSHASTIAEMENTLNTFSPPSSGLQTPGVVVVEEEATRTLTPPSPTLDSTGKTPTIIINTTSSKETLNQTHVLPASTRASSSSS